MSKRIMSDAEIKRRKRLQGHISQTTGAIGLAALGGTMVASRPGRKALRQIPKVDRVLKKPPPRDPNRDHIKGALTPALATSAGIGGLGAFNFAAYTNAESRKRKMAEPVKKSAGLPNDEMAPVFGEVAKAWSPVASNYDPESKRLSRNRHTQTAAYVGAGALAGGSALEAHKGVQLRREGAKLKKVKPKKTTIAPKFPDKPRSVSWAARETNKVNEATKVAAKAKAAKTTAKGTKTLVRAGKIGAGAAALAGAGEYVRRQRKRESWAPYSKRATSAFGVLHD